MVIISCHSIQENKNKQTNRAHLLFISNDETNFGVSASRSLNDALIAYVTKHQFLLLQYPAKPKPKLKLTASSLVQLLIYIIIFL